MTAETGPARRGSTERCTCGHTKRDHSGRRDHREKYGPTVAGKPWCHACETECIYCPPDVETPADGAPVTDEPDREDTCRTVEIDGETIHYRGAADLTEEGHQALTALVRAAKEKMAAEPSPIRQQLRAHAFNAVAPALKRHGEWLRLTVRRTVADAILAAIEEFLDIGDAEAWCKTCRRVWEGKSHRCESDAEQAVARVRAFCSPEQNTDQLGYLRRSKDVLAALDGEQPTPGPAATDGHVYLSTGCLHGQHDYCSNVDGIAGLKKPAQCKFCTAPCVCPCHQARAS